MTEDEFAEWLRNEMEKQHISHYKINQLTGLSYMTIRHYLDGARSPRLNTIKVLLDVLGMHIEIVPNHKE